MLEEDAGGAYASTAYYRNGYHGEFEGTDERLAQLLTAASLRIDGLTLNRVIAKGFENLTGFQQELIRRACCYQADYIVANGAENENGGISGYSVLDITVSVDQRTPRAAAERENVSTMAYMLLEQTGLLWKAVG
jgi:hypothetical protein